MNIYPDHVSCSERPASMISSLMSLSLDNITIYHVMSSWLSCVFGQLAVTSNKQRKPSVSHSDMIGFLIAQQSTQQFNSSNLLQNAVYPAEYIMTQQRKISTKLSDNDVPSCIIFRLVYTCKVKHKSHTWLYRENIGPMQVKFFLIGFAISLCYALMLIPSV